MTSAATTDKNRVLKRYRRRWNAGATLPEFYDDYLQWPAWQLVRDALPLARGANPKGEWASIMEEVGPSSVEIAHLAEGAVATGALKATKTDNGVDWWVKPNDFIDWLEQLGFEIFEPLKKAINNKQPVQPKTSKPGNTEVNAQKRERVLAAALACASEHEKHCKTKDRFVATKIVTDIEKHLPSECVLSRKKMEEIVRDALKMLR